MGSTRERGGRLAELTPYDCWALLVGVQIGRVAWSRPEGPAVVPVNLALLDGALWLRTTTDSALVREGVGENVAIEVDQVDLEARSGWSVLVLGPAELVEGDDVPEHLHVLEVWPSGARPAYVRVSPTQLTGRRLGAANTDH